MKIPPNHIFEQEPCVQSCQSIGAMYALLHRGTATAAHDLLFLLLTAALGALDWFFIRVQDRYPCTKEEK